MRNPGTLRISPERIYNGDYTQARNSTIQRMLRMVGFGDNIGSGFRKILNAWKSLGYPHPKIHEEREVNEVWLTLPLTKKNLSNKGDTVENSTVNGNKVENSTINGNKVENSTINGNKVENSTIKSKYESVSSISEAILSLIQDNPAITIEEMMDYLDKDRNTINYQIKKLKEANLIERWGSKKTGQWKIISK